MHKWINVLIILGVVFLVIFWILNPVMGLLVFIIFTPLFTGLLFMIILRRKLQRQMKEMVTSFQAEKEEIIKEIKRKEKRHQEQSESLQEFGKDLSSSVNKEHLLRVIVKMFSKATFSSTAESQCFLLSHDVAAGEFVYETGDNFDSNVLKAVRFSEKDELLDIIIKSKKIFTFVSDIFGGDSNIRYFLKEEKMTYLSQLGSLALIPLVLEDEVWGILVIFCGEDAAARIKNEEGFFRLLVVQASIALGSAIHRGLAAVDRLTQLYNRTFLQKRIKEEMEFCNRQLLPLSIMMIDIDFFKNVNDTYGHQEGDMVLKKIAQIISKNVRLTDICARYGGEEFVVVLPGIAETAGDRFSISERLRQAIESSDFIVLGNKNIKVTISIGVTLRRYPEDKEVEIEELIKRADTLLYKAKKEGRNRVCYQEEN